MKLGWKELNFSGFHNLKLYVKIELSYKDVLIGIRENIEIKYLDLSVQSKLSM